MLANTETFVDIAKSIKDADFAIEAVPEIINLESQIFPALDAAAPKYAILASNTSNISITKIASSTKKPKQGINMHFFNLAVLMRLVEVMKGEKTSKKTTQLTYNLALRMNKVADQG
jgi:3-hydroxybutyryl-CoA dehydrogenase